MTKRWAPVYDERGLARQIRDLAKEDALEQGFYSEEPREIACCQGDVVEMDSGIPYIDAEGDAAVGESSGYWMILGNTCDNTRAIAERPWTQVLPVHILRSDFPAEQLRDLRRYRNSREFFLPAWGKRPCCAADFTRPVSAHRGALTRSQRVARLSYRSWFLFHACIVRFLARDDGRHD